MTDHTQVPAGDNATDRDIARHVSQALRVLVSRMQLYADSVGHDLGLHRSDLMAMNLMSQASMDGHSMTPGEVAKKMSLSAAAVTALVDRLEDVGHLVRHPDANDRRRVRLAVSTQAERASRAMFRPMNERLYAALAHYTDEELDVVVRVLRDVTDAVEKADAQDAPVVAATRSTARSTSRATSARASSTGGSASSRHP
ncbi:MAG: MarR family transcriptional regulator [Ornithinimicrobium sp.]